MGDFLLILTNYDISQSMYEICNNNSPNGDKSYSDDGLDYIFSQFSGSMLGSTILFVIYIIKTGNKPFINSEAVIPSLISGQLSTAKTFQTFFNQSQRFLVHKSLRWS